MTNTTINTNPQNRHPLHVVKVEAIEGCTCGPEVRWFNCGCRGVRSTIYLCAPLNWQDVLSDGCEPDCVPCVESVAAIVEEHPGAQLIYIGGNQPICGPGAREGETHYQLACRIAENGSRSI